jgi:hypothetical protein
VALVSPHLQSLHGCHVGTTDDRELRNTEVGTLQQHYHTKCHENLFICHYSKDMLFWASSIQFIKYHIPLKFMLMLSSPQLWLEILQPQLCMHFLFTHTYSMFYPPQSSCTQQKHKYQASSSWIIYIHDKHTHKCHSKSYFQTQGHQKMCSPYFNMDDLFHDHNVSLYKIHQTVKLHICSW